jgi:hypothetical protein
MITFDLKVGIFSRHLLGGVGDKSTITRKLNLLGQLGLICATSRSLYIKSFEDFIGLLRIVNFTLVDLIVCRDSSLDDILSYRNPCNLRKALSAALSICSDANPGDFLAQSKAMIVKISHGCQNRKNNTLIPVVQNKFPCLRQRLDGLCIESGEHGFSLTTARAFEQGSTVISLRPEDTCCIFSAFRDERFPAADLLSEGLHPDTIFLLFLILMRDSVDSSPNLVLREFMESQPPSYGTMFEIPIEAVEALDEPDILVTVKSQNISLKTICNALHPAPEFKDILWAKSLCTSRAFSLPIPPVSDIEKSILSEYYPSGMITTLLPGVHFLNHDFSAQLMTPELNNAGDIEVKTLVDIESGSELFLLYGGFSNKDLMMNYGFFVEDNPYDSVEHANGDIVRRGALAAHEGPMEPVAVPDSVPLEYRDLIRGYLTDRNKFHKQISFS